MLGLTRVKAGLLCWEQPPWEVAKGQGCLDQAIKYAGDYINNSFDLSITGEICHRGKKGFLGVDLIPYNLLRVVIPRVIT